jgi:hypothetical protein
MPVLRWNISGGDRTRLAVRSKDLSQDDRRQLTNRVHQATCATCNGPGVLRGLVLYHRAKTCQARPQDPHSVTDRGAPSQEEPTGHDNAQQGPRAPKSPASSKPAGASDWFLGGIDTVVPKHHGAVLRQLESVDEPCRDIGSHRPGDGRSASRTTRDTAGGRRAHSALTVHLLNHHSHSTAPDGPWLLYVRRPGFLEIRLPHRPLNAPYLASVGVIYLIVSGAVDWPDTQWRWTDAATQELRASVRRLLNQPLTEYVHRPSQLFGLRTARLREVRFAVRP